MLQQDEQLHLQANAVQILRPPRQEALPTLMFPSAIWSSGTRMCISRTCMQKHSPVMCVAPKSQVRNWLQVPSLPLVKPPLVQAATKVIFMIIFEYISTQLEIADSCRFHLLIIAVQDEQLIFKELFQSSPSSCVFSNLSTFNCPNCITEVKFTLISQTLNL